MAEEYTLTSEQRNEITREAGTTIRRLRAYRRPFDSRRSEFYRQYIGWRDRRMFPDHITPRSNDFFMYPWSNVETVVSRAMDAYFSFDPWFECKGRGLMDEPAAEKMTIVMTKKLKDAEFESAFESVVRTMGIYGFGGIKVDWDWDYDIVTYAEPILATDASGQPVLNPQTGQPIVLGQRPAQAMVPRMRPRFTAIDIYDLMVDPDGRYVAHLTETSLGRMLRESQMNSKLYDPEGLALLQQRLAKEKNPGDVIVRISEVWDKIDGTCTILAFGEDQESISWKDQRAGYRSANLSSYTKRRLYGGEPILLWHGPNQFPHKQCPILYTSYVKLPNEAYGIGVIEPISGLTESMNRFVNMISDNWNLGINRRYAYDVNADIDHAALNNMNVPGGKVGVSGDPTKVIMPLPTHTPEAGDYMILELYKGMIEMTSGISDFYAKGVGAPTGNRTATGINNVIQESNFKFRMFIRNLERDIVRPLLQQVTSMIQAYTTDPIEIQITDDMPMIPKSPLVRPEELIGTFSYDLVAANYSSNKFVKQRNLLGFAEVAIQSPWLNQGEAIREFAKVYDIRNPKIVKSDDQVAMEQQQAMQQQIQMMIFEAMLQTESKARLQQSKPVSGKDDRGRPQIRYPSKIQGAGLESSIRSFAQAMGGNFKGMGGDE